MSPVKKLQSTFHYCIVTWEHYPAEIDIPVIMKKYLEITQTTYFNTAARS